MTTARYTGGNNGWGTLVYECADCGEVVAEYYCDENGIPTEAIFDYTDEHECEYDEEYEEEE